MEENHSFNPSFAPSPMTTSFTPIVTLLSKAWARVQKHLLSLFLLSVITFVLMVVLTIIVGVILFSTGFFSPGGTAIGAVIAIPVMMIVLTILMLGLQIATILLLAETQPALSLVQLYQMSLRRVWPLILVSFLTSLVVIGGVVMLVIPGILFGLLLSMAAYFVVLDHLAPIEAMKRSVYVVSKNFGAIFIRLAALFAISFGIGILFNLLSSINSGLSLIVSIASLIFNLLFSWVSVAFVLMVFQEAKKISGDGKGKLVWMVVVALIGWTILGFGGYFLYRASTNLPGFNDPSKAIPLENINNGPIFPISSPSASIRPASASASPRVTATPRSSATPRASAATSSANR